MPKKGAISVVLYVLLTNVATTPMPKPIAEALPQPQLGGILGSLANGIGSVFSGVGSALGVGAPPKPPYAGGPS